MKTEYQLTLDLNGAKECPVIWAKQGDDASRFVCITLMRNGEAYTPPEDATAWFRCVKPDLHSCLNPAQIQEDGTVTVELTEQVLAVSGIVEADVCLRNSEDVILSTVTFQIEVGTVPLGMGVVSSNEFGVLEETIERAEALKDGDSAYETAVEYGFEGTEEQWLASLKGEQGEQGVPGKTPEKGVDYFTAEDCQELTEAVLEELPIDVAEDGFTDITGVRRVTAVSITRSEEGIRVESSMEGGKMESAVLVLDGDGLPAKIVTGTEECDVTWNGFEKTVLETWTGGSY